MAILGLLSTESFASERFKNYRRTVFYFYPNGAAPLTGLLSMMDEEDTDDPEFNIYEKRLASQRTTTATRGSSKGPLTVEAGTGDTDPFTFTVDTVYRLHVADASIFRVGHIVRAYVTVSAAETEIQGVVTEVSDSTTPKYIKVRSLKTVASIDNGITNESVGTEVLVIGSAFAQGASGPTEEVYNLPIGIENYCGISRTPFSLTGTAAKTSAKFDETGPYKDKAKETNVQHSVEMERRFLFGEKHKFVDANNLPVYTSGGILWFLREWEKAASPYRGAASSALTANSDDEKRIINVNGAITERALDGYFERLFRVTNNTANEKLGFCGSGFLSIVNQLYKNKSVLDAGFPAKDAYGMSVVRQITPFGTIFWKTHPLFSANPEWRYNALMLDVRNLKYRYVEGRDTQLLKNRQNNGDDFRRDEYLSECGLELRFPESHMLLRNVTDWAP